MLARGELQTIGATTLDEYRKHLEKDAALERRFQPIKVEEPTVAQTIEILKGLRDRYEAHHRVTITDQAIVAAANLADRYISDRHLPDKAIDLIDEAGLAPAHPSHAGPARLPRARGRDRQGPQGEGSGDRGAAVRAGRDAARPREGAARAARAEGERVASRGRRPLQRGERGVDRRGARPLDRHPGLQAHRGRDRQAAAHGGRAAQADRRPGRRDQGGVAGDPPHPCRPQGPEAPVGLVHLPRPVGCRQDRDRQDARRVPVRRRGVDDPARHVASTWRSTRCRASSARLPATSATTRAASSPRPCAASRSRSCCSTRSRRPTPTCSTRCCRSSRTGASPTRRAARSTSRTP